MKLLLQNDDGAMVEIKEIEGLDKDSEVLFFFLKQNLRIEDREKLVERLKEITGRKVVILSPCFECKIVGLKSNN